jgi:serine/threonine protein kinase
MPVSAGTRFGAYEVTGPLGAGGMGEVYRARDVNLKREVALKVLPPGLSNDATRLARFQREAEVLAALNHPNIAQIYGLERGDGTTALAMELVDGPTLAERLAHGRLAVQDALHIAAQIAHALEAAHERGIVHRDLKPANIKVRPDGTVKVLDFGIAKALDAQIPGVGPAAETTPAMTEVGMVLGTAAYMSPEQARGQPVDKRTDVWAFGCVLFELLTGGPAFDGATATDVIARVLQTDPAWSELPPEAAALRRVLECCLEKDVRRRLRDIGDVALLLEDTQADRPLPVASSFQGSKRRGWIGVALVAAMIGGAGVASFEALHKSGVREPVMRFQVALSPSLPFAVGKLDNDVAISPDGSTLAYTGRHGNDVGLVVQRLDEVQGRWLPGTEGGTDPLFSPDGKEIAFHVLTALKRISVAGGPSTTISAVHPYFRGASWGADGTIVFAEFAFGLFRVPASGGQRETLALPNAGKQEAGFASPIVLPDGRTVLYTAVMTDGSSRILARRLGRDEVSTVVEDGFGPRYFPSGYLAFARGDKLMAVRFDASTLQAEGTPRVVEEGAFTKTADQVANMGAAANGTAVYVLGHGAGERYRVVWLDRRGARLGEVIGQPVEYPRNPRISPDGRRLAVTIGPDANGQVWVYDLAGGAQPLKLTFRDHGAFPVWSPDGKRVAFWWRTSPTKGLYSVAADGTSVQPEALPSEHDDDVPLDWAPDGEHLLYQIPPPHTLPKIGVLSLKDGRGHAWLDTMFADWGGRLSPDGRWLAYATNETGAFEVWVRPFPGPGAPVRVSASGGRKPLWSRDARELFFENGAQMLSSRIATDASGLRAEPPQVLFEGGFAHDDNPALRFMDVAPDGRFLVFEPADASASASIVVSVHWDQALRPLLSTE